MNFLISTKHRIHRKELMDDFSIGGDLLRDTLDKIGTINRWLGGNKVTLKGLKTILKNHPKEQEYTIIDIGCGHGDILRDVAKFGRAEKYRFNLIGVDANPTAIAYAKKLSTSYPELSFVTEDVFSKEFKNRTYDVVLATLFLHHFKEAELASFLKKNSQKATIGVVVNDLHRHQLAYYLFKGLTFFIKNKMIIEDGLTSILRGFKRQELIALSEKIQVKPQVSWKWAFRYLWIIQK